MTKGFETAVYALVMVLILNPAMGWFVPEVRASQLVLTKIAQVETGDAYDLWIDTDNHIAYVTCGYSGVKVFNVSNPHNPTQIANVSSSSNGYAHQLVMRDNLMLIGDGHGGLKIIDFETLSNPVVLTQYTGDYAWDVEVKGHVAFVANGLTGSGGKLTIVNVTNPTAPALLSSFTTVGDATDIEVVDHLAFVTTSYKGFTVFDVSNYTNPVQLAQYVGASASDTDLGDLEIVGNLAYLSYWDKGFSVLNISNLSDIEVISESSECQNSFSVHIDTERNLAFLCDLELGLLLLDVQTPTKLVEVARYSDGGKPNRVEVIGSLVYMTDQENGFVILEIEDNDRLTIGFELPLLIVGLASVLVIGGYLRKRSSMTGTYHTASTSYVSEME